MNSLRGCRAGWAALLAVGMSALVPELRAALELWVATDGHDQNLGSKDRPFATLEAARDALRQRAPTNEDATVWVRGGVYPRRQTFTLGPPDAGRRATYRAAPGEVVRLLGGRRLEGLKALTDPAVRARLDEKARGQVLELNLRELGITDFGSMKSRGFGRPIVPAHCELFFAGRPMTLARWPNTGEWARIAGYPQEQTDEHGGKLGPLPNGFLYEGDRPQRWQATPELWVHGYWAYDWANSYERVERLDKERRLIQTAPPHGHYGYRKGQRYFFLNLLEELDQPGEWYLDRQSGMLYFWPPGPVHSAEVMLSLLEGPLISLEEVSGVTIRGLHLEASRGHGVVIRGGSSNLIAACALRLHGNYAVWIAGGRHHGVSGCDLEDTGDGGVSLSGGDRRTLEAGGHYVVNCSFRRQGRWSRCYVPAVLLEGVGLRVAHCLIEDHPHCAILYGGNEHVLELNEIHHVAFETGDVGAIYAGRDYTYRGNRIRHNFIHHTGGVGMGSMGAYMDDCVSGTEISGNVFYQVTRAAFLGGGRDHHVENNIFVDCRPAVQLDGRGLDPSPVWHNMVYDFMRQRLEEMPRDLYRARYPELAPLDRYYQSTNGIPPEGNLVRHNICWGGKWLEVGWHARPEMLEAQDNLVDQDPRFVSVEKLDFRLAPDSPAWKIGFKPIPFEQIGLQNDELRRELAHARSLQVHVAAPH